MSKPSDAVQSFMPNKVNDSIPTRLSLLNRLKDWRDDASWRDFFDTYGDLLYHVARKAGLTDTEAEEAVQETIIGVSKKIGGFETDPSLGSFKAWLLHQARWRIADQFAKRNATIESAAARDGVGENDPTGTSTSDRIPDPASCELESLWDSEWQHHLTRLVLEKVRAQVSVKQFQMFDLHILQGLSVSEAARTLDVSMASVYMAKSRISRLMRCERDLLTKNR
jgi:RNA polymerase sigma factor (sigma-70 family)